MRLRNNPKATDIMEENREYVIIEPLKHKSKWNTVFGNNNPIYIEIGMGKGDFLYQHALHNPTINYIGIEKYPSVLATAITKINQKGKLPNLRVLSFDAIDLKEIFDSNEVQLIYLNFSDPWPKNRHAKRRLTSHLFLRVYKDILSCDGSIEFKTDNRELFEYSLVSLNTYKMQFELVSLDLHNSCYSKDNIMSEYERKFCSKGPIYKLIGRF